jgi:hypothetical protein
MKLGINPIKLFTPVTVQNPQKERQHVKLFKGGKSAWSSGPNCKPIPTLPGRLVVQIPGPAQQLFSEQMNNGAGASFTILT